jgi:hypothetical protein
MPLVVSLASASDIMSGDVMAKKVEKKTNEGTELEHLEWLVRCRSQNQHTSMLLYKLMTEYKERLKHDKILESAGISLVAISFNLWRAVFLADAKELDADRGDHAVAFLKTLISDNAIAYTQDRSARAWTFLTYLNNARFRLGSIAETMPQILPNFTEPASDFTLKQRWEHHQTNADLAVGNYANALTHPSSNN